MFGFSCCFRFLLRSLDLLTEVLRRSEPPANQSEARILFPLSPNPSGSKARTYSHLRKAFCAELCSSYITAVHRSLRRHELWLALAYLRRLLIGPSIFQVVLKRLSTWSRPDWFFKQNVNLLWDQDALTRYHSLAPAERYDINVHQTYTRCLYQVITVNIH